MSETCNCDDQSLGNLGKPNCVALPGVDEYFIFAPFFDSTGAVQSILKSATLDADYFNDRLNKYDTTGAEVNAANRWYPTPILEEVNNERGETTFKEWASGRREKVKDGVRTVTVTIKNATFLQLKELKKTGCTEIGVLKVDGQGNIIGNGVTEPTKIRFLKIDKASWDATLMFATYDTNQHIVLTFQWGANEKDSNLQMIKSDSITGYSITDMVPSYLIDADQVGTMSTTEHVVDVYTTYGDAIGSDPVLGLVSANFEYHNTTDSVDNIAVTAVPVPGVDGRYTLTYAAQTAADKMRLRIIEAGMDDSLVYATEYTIGT